MQSGKNRRRPKDRELKSREQDKGEIANLAIGSREYGTQTTGIRCRENGHTKSGRKYTTEMHIVESAVKNNGKGDNKVKIDD